MVTLFLADEIFQSDTEDEDDAVQVTPLDLRKVDETCSPNRPWPMTANVNDVVIGEYILSNLSISFTYHSLYHLNYILF